MSRDGLLPRGDLLCCRDPTAGNDPLARPAPMNANPHDTRCDDGSASKPASAGARSGAAPVPKSLWDLVVRVAEGDARARQVVQRLIQSGPRRTRAGGDPWEAHVVFRLREYDYLHSALVIWCTRAITQCLLRKPQERVSLERGVAPEWGTRRSRRVARTRACVALSTHILVLMEREGARLDDEVARDLIRSDLERCLQHHELARFRANWGNFYDPYITSSKLVERALYLLWRRAPTSTDKEELARDAAMATVEDLHAQIQSKQRRTPIPMGTLPYPHCPLLKHNLRRQVDRLLRWQWLNAGRGSSDAVEGPAAASDFLAADDEPSWKTALAARLERIERAAVDLREQFLELDLTRVWSAAAEHSRHEGAREILRLLFEEERKPREIVARLGLPAKGGDVLVHNVRRRTARWRRRALEEIEGWRRLAVQRDRWYEEVDRVEAEFGREIRQVLQESGSPEISYRISDRYRQILDRVFRGIEK